MSFKNITGAPVIRASKSDFNDLKKFVTSELGEDDPDIENARIADIALAVGIAENETAKVPSDGQTQFNLDSLDKQGVMKVIIEERHPEAEPQELRSLLQDYLEGGIQEISSQINDGGVFDYHRYLDMSENQV